MKRKFVVNENGKQDIRRIVIFSLVGLFVLVTVFCSFQTIKSGEVGLNILRAFCEMETVK
ncbi:MAG: hypothetical protein IJD89_05655 [Clostridia bacterium]|nr:hypothetical protein [Clostridia bacterium]